MKGRIELIIGPMFASKSTELIRIANRYKSINKKILAINHKINIRYGHDQIITHDKNILDKCLITDKLMDLYDMNVYHEADIIIIEELQFFEDAFEFVTKSADIYGKTIIAAGLSGNYKREPFGDVLRIIPYADKVLKLSALCKFCEDGTEAHFTKKLKLENNRKVNIEVGSSDKYEAVCRKHYLD